MTPAKKKKGNGKGKVTRQKVKCNKGKTIMKRASTFHWRLWEMFYREQRQVP